MLKLYTYSRSVSTHRVRIALAYKGILYEPVYIDIGRSREHLSEEYLRLNPQGLVPAMIAEGELMITQSFAILEYLEERYPERPLLPSSLALRAKVRSFAQIAVADLHPLVIMRVFLYMRDEMDIPYDKRRAWYEHWAHKGLKAMETFLLDHAGTSHAYCFGDKPTLADVCLVPQLYNARYFELDLQDYPRLRQVYQSCMALGAFQSAAPETQSDVLKGSR